MPPVDSEINITNRAAAFNLSKFAATCPLSRTGQTGIVRSRLHSAQVSESAFASQAAAADIVYDLLRECPNAVRAAIACLDEYGEKGVVDVTLEPQEMFVREQFRLSLCEIRTKLKGKKLRLDDIRENLENMFGLLEHLLHTKSMKAALMCRNMLVTAIYKTEELARRMEVLIDETLTMRTDWKSIRENLVLVNITATAEQDMMSYVPAMSMFRAKTLLGVGGFGVVYRAKFGQTVTVVVKLVPKERFTSGSIACTGKLVGSMVSHALLVRQFGCFETIEAFVTVMELIEGVEVRDLTRAVRGLPILMIKIIIGQLCLGLRYLHQTGFIHRDVKPANMMITSGARVKLIDFDTSKVCIGLFVRNHPLESFFRRSGKEIQEREAIGTIPFMAPEILRGKPFGKAIDWWAVGVTIYNLHTNTYPFLGKNYDAKKTQKKIVRCVYEWPQMRANAPPEEMVDIVQRFLKKRADKRLGVRDYSPLENHAFFAEFDWTTWDSGRGNAPWPQLDKLIAAQKARRAKENAATLKSSKKIVSQRDTKQASKKSKELLKLKDLTIADKHTPLHTTFSLAFRSAVTRLRAEETIPADALDEPIADADANDSGLAKNTANVDTVASVRQIRFKLHRGCNQAEQELATANSISPQQHTTASGNLALAASGTLALPEPDFRERSKLSTGRITRPPPRGSCGPAKVFDGGVVHAPPPPLPLLPPPIPGGLGCDEPHGGPLTTTGVFGGAGGLVANTGAASFGNTIGAVTGVAGGGGGTAGHGLLQTADVPNALLQTRETQHLG